MTITEFLLSRIAEDEHEANVSLDMYRRGGPVSTRRWKRVLAECAAKRAIIERHPIHVYQGIHGQAVPECAVGDGFPCDTLQALAAVYADHPDYRQEWGLVH